MINGRIRGLTTVYHGPDVNQQMRSQWPILPVAGLGNPATPWWGQRMPAVHMVVSDTPVVQQLDWDKDLSHVQSLARCWCGKRVIMWGGLGPPPSWQKTLVVLVVIPSKSSGSRQLQVAMGGGRAS